MKKLTFKTPIYLGFSVLIILLSASLLYGFLLSGRVVFLMAAVLAFMAILWIFVYVAKSVGALQAQQEELRTINDKQSGQYKNEFLANMSHELRTPLNSILILAKLLENNKPGNLLPEQVQYATIIHRGGSELLNLINNILDLAKIESGNVALIIERIEYSDIAQDLFELFSSVADSKAIDFHMAIDDELPPFIITDGQRLKQILNNLLANAFKFTGENGRIALSFARANQSPAWKAGMLNGIAADQVVAVSVTDTGIGIAEDKQQLIFEAFKQADGSTSRRFGGTGLGLSICRELATALGGEIHVTSEEHKGSTFTLFIPLRYVGGAGSDLQPVLSEVPTITGKQAAESLDEVFATLPQAVAPPLKNALLTEAQDTDVPQVFTDVHQALKGKRIFLVDDDMRNIFALSTVFSTYGIKVEIANNGIEALDVIQQQPNIDLVLMDIMMPALDGYEAIKKIRTIDRLAKLPIIAMTAKAKQGDKRHALDAGANDYIAKPIAINELLSLIRVWLS
ncbi:ATP-binding protein [Parapedobacter koreensis]|uniref:histidine kinase n=1 Tax=Parapedobacter koreensis TaxID=332977 RepID=A0A1H7J6L7_9SPHI|nr:ATP-binding protein [Parapedobacter koreensis]SEK70328.1 two-component system, chemotaxis family, sensor kinase CheA [Parapedobacter koreensis]